MVTKLHNFSQKKLHDQRAYTSNQHESKVNQKNSATYAFLTRQARPQAFPSPRGRSPSARGQLERGSRRGAAGAAEAPPTGVERSFLPVKRI